MAATIRVLIADDQSRARQGLRALLSTWTPVVEIRESANGREAVQMVEAFEPDLVLMDVRMPETDGLQATRTIKARWPRVKVILLSMYSDQEQEARAAGADAFVGKQEAPHRLLDVVSAVMQSGDNINPPHKPR